jgi:hypothetical protein
MNWWRGNLSAAQPDLAEVKKILVKQIGKENGRGHFRL